MAQTAMQEFIDDLIKYDKLLDGRRKSEDSTIFKISPTKLYKKALEKEKEQTINFHIMLMKNGLEQEGSVIDWNYDELKQEALKFYNQTYNQNK